LTGSLVSGGLNLKFEEAGLLKEEAIGRRDCFCDNNDSSFSTTTAGLGGAVDARDDLSLLLRIFSSAFASSPTSFSGVLIRSRSSSTALFYILFSLKTQF
jgi:hypothetical protein